MQRYVILVLGLVLSAFVGATGHTDEIPARDRPLVVTARLDNEAITPATARFITRAIQQAEQQGAQCLILVLDTPGGLVDSTREVVKGIIQSKVPVVVYVAPSGARAASAGVFITLAGHVAAMAPGTNIGAAHPVQIGGLPGSPPQQPEERQPTDKADKKDDTAPSRATSPMEEKVLNDTVAWARSLAELRGRNVEWATRAVRESISASASEAVQAGAVDLMAQDINDLLGQIEGREVTLIQGKARLEVAGAELRTVEMWWGERFLAALANPNLALLLLIFGFYGILFELYTPGWGVPGTVGIICLVLGFFAMAVLPINYVGLALIVIALGLFVAEAFVTSFGFLTLAGLACLITGGLMLVDSPVGFLRVSAWILIPISLATAAITIVLVGSVIKAHRAPAQTGMEAMSRAKTVAAEEFVLEGDCYTGIVRTHGELWKAVSQAPVAAGQALEIQGREGLTLLVRPFEAEQGRVTPIRNKRREHIA